MGSGSLMFVLTSQFLTKVKFYSRPSEEGVHKPRSQRGHKKAKLLGHGSIVVPGKNIFDYQ